MVSLPLLFRLFRSAVLSRAGILISLRYAGINRGGNQAFLNFAERAAHGKNFLEYVPRHYSGRDGKRLVHPCLRKTTGPACWALARNLKPVREDGDFAGVLPNLGFFCQGFRRSIHSCLLRFNPFVIRSSEIPVDLGFSREGYIGIETIQKLVQISLVQFEWNASFFKTGL